MGLRNSQIGLKNIMQNKIVKRKIFYFFILFIPFILIVGTIKYNRYKIKPNSQEILLLKRSFGNIEINSIEDIFRINSLVIKEVEHGFNGIFPISIVKVLNDKKGLCYDRSMVLQKIFIYNNIPIRPVFLYYGQNQNDISILNLLDKNLNSHNVFEFYYKDQWLLMPTSSIIKELIDLEDYIKKSKMVPKNTKYIRHLNNRNGSFICPNWLPDIY
jgi:hypothetical protein